MWSEVNPQKIKGLYLIVLQAESQIEAWKSDFSEENKFIMTSLKSLWMEQEIRVKKKIKEVKGRGFMLHFAVYTLFKRIMYV